MESAEERSVFSALCPFFTIPLAGSAVHSICDIRIQPLNIAAGIGVVHHRSFDRFCPSVAEECDCLIAAVTQADGGRRNVREPCIEVGGGGAATAENKIFFDPVALIREAVGDQNRAGRPFDRFIQFIELAMTVPCIDSPCVVGDFCPQSLSDAGVGAVAHFR